MFRKTLLGALLLLISQFSWAENGYGNLSSFLDFQLQINENDGQVNLGPYGKTPKISYEIFKKARPKSMDDFLQILESKAPELFDQYVVVHSSGSLQPSTPKKPRVLLFGENLTLSVSALQDKNQSVEILQFDNQNFQFTMHEIVFEQLGQVRFNDKPKECASCHGQPAKPVWEAYDFWPSALGSRSGLPIAKQEKELMSWFEKTKHTHPVLKRLRPKNLKSGIDAFTMYINQQNLLQSTKTIEADMKPGGKLYPFRYAVLAMLSCVDLTQQSNIEDNLIYKDYLPQAVRDQWGVSFSEVYYDVVDSNQLIKELLWVYYGRNFARDPMSMPASLTRLRKFEIVQGSQLGYIFANLGLDLKEFGLSFRKDSYIMSTPGLFESDLQKTFIYHWPEVLGEIDHKVLGIDFGASFYDFNCQQLKQKSLAELSNYKASRSHRLLSAKGPKVSQAPYASCTGCHTRPHKPSGSRPPYIPFDNTFKLARELRNTDLLDKIKDRISRDDIKQMPRDLPPLTKKQRQSLLSTLEKIKASPF